MSCTYNPQGLATMSSSNVVAAYPQTNSFSNSSTIPLVNGDTGYAEMNQWGETIPVNPNTPSSPLSVQPNGRGTPLIGQLPGGGVTTLPGEIPTTGIEPLPETLTQHIYTPGYLSAYIGRLMRVEFLIGSQTTDRVGYLREVGASYIVLESVDYGNLMMCDLYSIKFVTILKSQMEAQVASLYEER